VTDFPDGWPPRAGDVWRDPYGDSWMGAGDDIVQLVYWTGSIKDAEVVLEAFAPLTLVHREPESEAGQRLRQQGESRQRWLDQERKRMCPACMSMVPVGADDVLAEHGTGTAISTRCVGSGVTVKGEHQ
jgi:hypothetical protein